MADRRVFTVYPGMNVIFEHLIIQNGVSDFGGGILSWDNVTFNDCIIQDNFSNGFGGGIFQDGYNITINNCLIDGNIAFTGGGGLYLEDCDANITNSTIANNSCTDNLGNGAGISVTNTSIAQNILIENCTVINNVVNYNSYGGGINLYSQIATLTTEIINTTFVYNEGADGDGVYQEAFTGTTNDLTLLNCILDNGTSENYATTGSGTNNLTRTYTICRDATLPVAGTGNFNSTNPQLGIYGNHGGLTPTIPLLEGSPAKNAGTSIDAPEFDQRGSFREGIYDIGSYEFTSQLAGDYTINNEEPTNFPSGTNFNSFEDAINALNFGGISDYVTFYVIPDQIFEEPPLLIYTTGTEEMPITFMTDQPVKANAILKGTGGIYGGGEPSAEADMIIALQAVNYITFYGIDFMDNETNSTPEEKMEMGIVLFDTENIIIDDCSVSLTPDERTTMGVVIVSENESSNYNLIENNTIQNCSMGIGLFGNEDIISSNNQITDNTFSSIGDINSPFAVAISAENQTDLLLTDNFIDDLTGNDDSYVVGISAENCEASISGNSILNIDGGGCIGMQINNGTYEISENNIENISSNEMTAGIMTYSSTVEIYENYLENFSSDGMIAGISSEYSDLNFYDNYLYNFVGNSIMGISVYAEDNEIEIANDTLENFTAEEIIFGMKLQGNNSSFYIYSNILTEFSSVTDDCMLVGIFADDEDEEITSNFSIHENKIYDFEINATTGFVSAIYNNHDGFIIIYNNLIYDLYNSNFNSVDGMSIAAITIGKGSNSLLYNTVYLNDEPLFEDNFNTLLFYDGEPTSQLNMQNNIFTNNTNVSNGNLAVAFTNSAEDLFFLAPITNNNLYFVGIEDGSANQLIYMDFIGGSVQTINNYKAMFGNGCENASITENPPFISTEYPQDFNIDTEVETGIESGGLKNTIPYIIATDIDNKLRWGETGYNGGGTAPDIGAYERYDPDVNINNIKNNSISIYPNPTTGIITIENNSQLTNNNEQLTITDITGKIVSNFQFSIFNSQFSIDLSEYGKGVYFIRIQTDTSFICKKVIVK